MKRGDLIKLTWPDGDEEEGIFHSKERGFVVIYSAGNRIVGCLSTLQKVEIIKENEKISTKEYNKFMGIKDNKKNWYWISVFAFIIFALIVA